MTNLHELKLNLTPLQDDEMLDINGGINVLEGLLWMAAGFLVDGVVKNCTGKGVGDHISDGISYVSAGITKFV
jgi:hypothetical protein